MFTENRNTENVLEDTFLNSSECLTGEVIEATNVLENIDYTIPEIDVEMAEIETNLGLTKIQVPNPCIDLLNQFEFEVMKNNNINVQIIGAHTKYRLTYFTDLVYR